MKAGLTFLASFLGVFSRAMLPYIRKRKKKTEFKFKYGYLGTAAVGFIIAILIYDKVPTPEITDVQTGLEAFCSAFGIGFGWHSIINEAGKWSGAFS